MTSPEPDSWVYFIEVDIELIPIRLIKTLHEIGGIALWSLYLPYLRIRFFRPETKSETEERINKGIRKKGILHYKADAIGFVDYPDDVWIRYDLSTRDAIRVIAHEAYHLAQMRDYPRLRYRDTTSNNDLIKMEHSASLFEKNFFTSIGTCI
ncbi:MAG: hypothetical protein M1371_04125 [Actinobacteria bacterium]|nr:hypothetical protein [Actinomycetota bacterium]